MSKKLLIIAGIAVISAFAFFAIRPAYMSSDPRPVIRIGFSMPMSGDSAHFGKAARHGVRLFFEDFDADAAHYRYEIIFEDNRFQSGVAASVAHKMIAANRVNAIVSLASHIGGPTNPIAERAGVIHISASIDPDVARGEYNFIIISSARGQAQAVIRHLQNLGVGTITLVHEIVSGQQVFINALKSEIKGTGIEIKSVYPVNKGERDFRPILQRIANDTPDMILPQFSEPEIAIFLRQYHQSGITIPLFSADSFSFLGDKTLAEGLYYVATASGNDDFTERYERLVGSTATNFAEYMHAILQILTTAFEANPDAADNTAAARAILEKTDGLETVIGVVTICPGGIIDAPTVLRKIENG
ncbi:MAG: ABC transporter substrate-binding protein, partial [Alphaproteobacteria bacterium]|nr:ABC transporter substrate-binding protein [Alphaproteobacteria bacterium]